MKTSAERSRIARGAKKKGSRAERNIAKELSEHFKVELHRTPASGGLRWHQMQGLTRGDLVTDSPGFPFCIEVKNRESWDLRQLLEGNGSILDWWEQATDDATAVNKVPLLLFTKNYHPFYVLFNEMQMKPFKKELDQNGLINHLIIFHKGAKLIVMDLKSFKERY